MVGGDLVRTTAGQMTLITCNQLCGFSGQGAVVLLLGTKDELAAAPVEVPKFIEDMNENELASAVRNTNTTH